ncbi:MAG TPA: ParB/Srx family N-terminal domain-containing protein [Tepidisphaeraceae bacterium]|jgi:hypothetical protein|nr:ParB/Srx family N-terminal domain-containing protein [Tepidisphaeraceae bacterium]
MNEQVLAARMKKSTPIGSEDFPDKRDLVSVDDLLFDDENPRLIEYTHGKKPSQSDLLGTLWQEMAVDELVMSIVASGFFEHEPLFVIPRGKKYVVIEGNRRLAAVQLILDKKLREEHRAGDLPDASPALRKSLQQLPVVITTRKGAWRYLGFKHVNGPAKWDSYPKAQYISEVHNKYQEPLDAIARQIGDKHNTVQRLYRALMVIEQAERAKKYDRDDRYKGHFSFSHLYTGLDYEGIAHFVSLTEEKSESKTPVPAKKLDELGELCLWLYGSRSRDVRPVVESQNPHLRQLDEVLKSKTATESLRAGLPLALALEASYGDERVFQNSLVQAKEALQKARGTLSTGFTAGRELLDLGENIADLANDLLSEMRRKESRDTRGKGRK